MHWKRLVKGAFWVALVILMVPLVCLVVVIVLIALLVIGIGRGVKYAWNSLPRHRRALAHAREAFASRCPGRIAADWHVCRPGRQKCIVRARLAGVSQPEAVWLCAVWDGSGQVDDLGTWQFLHGVGVRHAVRAYEAARTAGHTWPTGMAQLLQTVPAEQLPTAARPGLHPHEGTVLVVNPDGIAFYAFAEVANETTDPFRAGKVEAYDADCRRLYFDRQDPEEPPLFLAPIPPTPRDKVFMEELRHFLLSRAADEPTREMLRQMTVAELVEYGLQNMGELDETFDDVVE